MVPFDGSRRAVGRGRFGLFPRQLCIRFLGVIEMRLRWFRKQVPTRKRLSSSLYESNAFNLIRRATSKIYRTGYRQYFLYEIESVHEHVSDCVHLFMDVAREIGLSQEETVRGVYMLEIHELDEAITGVDEPLIPTRDMPKSRAGREAFQTHDWDPPTREQELLRLQAKLEKHKPLFEEWFREHVPVEERPGLMELIREFHHADTPLAVICFEVHALQAASKAVFLALEEGVKFTPTQALPFVWRAEKLITNRHVKARLEALKADLVAHIEPVNPD